MSQATSVLVKYLFNAMYEWAMEYIGRVDILVSLNDLDDQVLHQHQMGGGLIILNIAMEAVKDLQVDDTHISFNCRFNGVSSYHRIPLKNVLAVRGENGVFHMLQGLPVITPQDVPEGNAKSSAVEEDTKPKTVETTPVKPPVRKKPTLSIVK